MRGTVFNIQSYSLHDGPGIRTIVFLKGCPLRCGWCSNPESQETFPEVYFDKEKCISDKGCGFCSALCDIGSFSASRANAELCGSCDAFRSVCPSGALGVYGYEAEVGDILDRVEAESAFYSHGGGGMTLSGGEPFMQGEFALELLRESKRRRINTAAETCGMCRSDVLRDAAGLLDTVLFDIKTLDEQKHIEHTGCSNKMILENLEMLFSDFPKLRKIIRTPVIPGVNDSERELSDIRRFLDGRENFRHELLPYHRFGERKYALLGRGCSTYP
ncbi:pyruvate formate lyase activating enzyme [Ruminococcus sp. YE71]|uniref:glycyl-radical enzyme activating protein n=1 Tax=unclassified Ruminococcus TaxID=2608920 RepID=UPI000891A75E|nr:MULTISPECIES: glycyl-radical enzyme activating protein [unclassified Ruminococcus]SDA30390.1 pyruvate formate lyase activating enzyme [Ruminococcus sp. YE78]SFW49551.1 pyruvate formate lyase activating enzyme [Ruminococcus sp. YE71]